MATGVGTTKYIELVQQCLNCVYCIFRSWKLVNTRNEITYTKVLHYGQAARVPDIWAPVGVLVLMLVPVLGLVLVVVVQGVYLVLGAPGSNS